MLCRVQIDRYAPLLSPDAVDCIACIHNATRTVGAGYRSLENILRERDADERNGNTEVREERAGSGKSIDAERHCQGK